MVDQGARQVKLLVTFFAVSAALYGQKLLEKQNTTCAVIPVPRSVSSSCGYAMEVLYASAASLTKIMNSANIEWAAVYKALGNDEDGKYQLIEESSPKDEGF